MFIIRNAIKSDLDDIYALSQKVNLLNLPSDKDELSKLISTSNQSFKKPDIRLENNYYLFCVIDISKNKTVGVSMIHGKHGTAQKPHYFLKVSKEVKKSSTLNTEIINHTLKLGIEPNGYTEIGGLILDPKYRGLSEKLGKQLSMARFLFIVQNKQIFTEKIHSELLPPFDKDGKSLLWEGLGRKFLNMDYWEADILSQKNKTFIHDLFPSSTIYQNLLPISALNVIGKVGDSTKPVKKMLEGIGFNYTNEVDPFDGGPHYRAKLVELLPYKQFNEISGDRLINELNQEDKNLFLSDLTCEQKSEDVFFYARAFRNEDQSNIKKMSLYKGFFI
jgi:arginine N-succinyltransferase